MSDHTSLLEDPTIAAAVTSFVKPHRGHRVVGLHDGVMVRDKKVEKEDIFDGMGWYAGSKLSVTLTAPYSTVEVILATPTGRVYAERHKVTLDEFLDLAGVTAAKKAS